MQQTGVQQFHQRIAERGGKFSLAGERVRIMGCAVSLQELEEMEAYGKELAQFIYREQMRRTLQRYEAGSSGNVQELPRTYEAVLARIEEWKRSFPQSRGYLWKQPLNWRSERAAQVLSRCIEEYVAGTASLEEVHENFRALAYSVQRTGHLYLNHGTPQKVLTVTPQVQPQRRDYERWQRLCGGTGARWRQPQQATAAAA